MNKTDSASKNVEGERQHLMTFPGVSRHMYAHTHNRNMHTPEQLKKRLLNKTSSKPPVMHYIQ